MAKKHVSRSKRASETADAWRDIATKLRELADDSGSADLDDARKEELVKEAEDIVSAFDTGELEALTEEITSWRDNMSGANMEHLPKFEEVDSAASDLESIDTDSPDIDDFDDIERVADDLEQRAEDLEAVSFPGMF